MPMQRAGVRPASASSGDRASGRAHRGPRSSRRPDAATGRRHQHRHRAQSPTTDRHWPGLPAPDQPSLVLTVPALLKRAGMETKLLVPAAGSMTRAPDRSLLRLLAQAQHFKQMIMRGDGSSISEPAAEAGVSRSYLPHHQAGFPRPRHHPGHPDGLQSVELSAKNLAVCSNLPTAWSQQVGMVLLTNPQRRGSKAKHRQRYRQNWPRRRLLPGATTGGTATVSCQCRPCPRRRNLRTSHSNWRQNQTADDIQLE